MPAVRQTVWVGRCPSCGEPVDATGEGGFQVYETVREMREMFQDTDGKTLEEKLAATCSDRCDDLHRHRKCFKKPCGYCKSRGTGWMSRPSK